MATDEERTDRVGSFRPEAAGEVGWSEPCGERYFQASPYIDDVSVPEPDPGCEALQNQGAQLVGEWQLAPRW
jgi:hypothetical protein